MTQCYPCPLVVFETKHLEGHIFNTDLQPFHGQLWVTQLFILIKDMLLFLNIFFSILTNFAPALSKKACVPRPPRQPLRLPPAPRLKVTCGRLAPPAGERRRAGVRRRPGRGTQHRPPPEGGNAAAWGNTASAPRSPAGRAGAAPAAGRARCGRAGPGPPPRTAVGRRSAPHPAGARGKAAPQTRNPPTRQAGQRFGPRSGRGGRWAGAPPPRLLPASPPWRLGAPLAPHRPFPASARPGSLERPLSARLPPPPRSHT